MLVRRVASFVYEGIVTRVLLISCLGLLAGSATMLDEESKFAQDVILHVVIHELGHALIREFDLPVLGNEETMADAFATYYLTEHLPDRAFDVIKARTRPLMIEANEVPGMNGM